MLCMFYSPILPISLQKALLIETESQSREHNIIHGKLAFMSFLKYLCPGLPRIELDVGGGNNSDVIYMHVTSELNIIGQSNIIK